MTTDKQTKDAAKSEEKKKLTDAELAEAQARIARDAGTMPRPEREEDKEKTPAEK